jgi:anti-sigma B factor antagonist
MNITITEQPHVTIVHLEGEINGRTAPHIHDALMPLAQPGRQFLLDMSRVSHVSAGGQRALLLLCRHLSDNGHRPALVNLNEAPHDTLANTGFLDFFTTYDTLDEGLAALRKT